MIEPFQVVEQGVRLHFCFLSNIGFMLDEPNVDLAPYVYYGARARDTTRDASADNCSALVRRLGLIGKSGTRMFKSCYKEASTFVFFSEGTLGE